MTNTFILPLKQLNKAISTFSVFLAQTCTHPEPKDIGFSSGTQFPLTCRRTWSLSLHELTSLGLLTTCFVINIPDPCARTHIEKLNQEFAREYWDYTLRFHYHHNQCLAFLKRRLCDHFPHHFSIKTLFISITSPFSVTLLFFYDSKILSLIENLPSSY